MVMGIVVGLGITRMLTGVASFIQHPDRHQVSALHLLWAGSMLLEFTLFWWWEFGLTQIEQWNLGVFLFLVAYAVVLYLLAALLFPDHISEYNGYEDFFIKRRRWFFGLLATGFVLDVVDTLIKGGDYWSRLSRDYLIQVPIGLTLCLVGVLSTNRRLQIALVLTNIAYQGYLATRLISIGQ
jgi:hypothetical protein